MDGRGVLVVGHFFWHVHGTREASKIPLPIKVFSNEVLPNCPRGAGEPYIAYGMTPPIPREVSQQSAVLADAV